MFQNNVLFHKGVSLLGRLGDLAIPEVGHSLEIAQHFMPRNDNGKGCLLKLSKNPFFFKEEGVQRLSRKMFMGAKKINKLFPFNLSLFALAFGG